MHSLVNLQNNNINVHNKSTGEFLQNVFMQNYLNKKKYITLHCIIIFDKLLR